MKIEASEQIQCLVDSQIFEFLLSLGRCQEMLSSAGAVAH